MNPSPALLTQECYLCSLLHVSSLPLPGLLYFGFPLSPSLPWFHFSAFLPLSFCFMCHFYVLLFFQKDIKMSLRWEKKGLVTATDSSTSAFLKFAFLWRAVTEWCLCAFSMGVFKCGFSLFQDSSEIENLGQLDCHPGGFSGDSGGC